MKLFRNFAVLAVASCVTFALGADPIRMDLRSSFSGPLADTSAVTVVLENDGPDAVGGLRVSGENGDTLYPVELPRGARKKLLTLPSAPWGELRFTLDTNRGSLVRTMMAQPAGNDMGGSVVLIGDDSGALGFLRKQTEEKRSITTRDAYVTAEDAPDRSSAYRTYSTIVLGPGAERLNDRTVEALKDYALGGGSIIFLGGASAPVLEDSRWTSILPGRGWQPKTLASSSVLSGFGDGTATGSFTYLSPGKLVNGALVKKDGAAVLESQRGFGLGRIIVLGYSPLEPPLSTWSGRVRAVSRFVRSGDGQRSRQFTENYLNQGMDNVAYYSSGPFSSSSTVTYSTTTTVGPGGIPVRRMEESDPFSTTLPATSTVFGILAAYFVLVVPISFLVLRKMKRGELAWITAPILSLGFAGLLFKSAQGLYSASLSTASQGVLVLQEGVPNGLFFGTSQMFFPRGGVYDLKLQGVERMTSVRSPEDYYGQPADSLAGFNPIDVGEIIAPKLEANNLAFRELSYTQKFEAPGWFRFQRTDDGHATVENRSPYDFSGTFVNGVYEGNAFTLSPGAKKSVVLKQGSRVENGSSISVDDPRNFTRWNGRLALRGRLTGFRPGPQLGNEVKGRSGIAVVAFSEETVR